jgi:CYTH domain-containing protein
LPRTIAASSRETGTLPNRGNAPEIESRVHALVTIDTRTLEIERRFLIHDDSWRPGPSGARIRQGYLARTDRGVVRIRSCGDQAFITIKGPTHGLTRSEFEYSIPEQDVDGLFQLCDGTLIEKTRYLRSFAGSNWEIDEFHGLNAGLVIAEIELESEQEAFELPPWAETEISHCHRYANSNLSLRPYSQWSLQERTGTAD